MRRFKEGMKTGEQNGRGDTEDVKVRQGKGNRVMGWAQRN